MSFVKIYTASYCSYCQDAKDFFKGKDIPYEEIDVTSDLEKRQWLKEVTKKHTVPQIFIHGISTGGYSDLIELDRQGKLAALLDGTAKSL